MWAIGLIVYFLFHKIAITWYLGLYKVNSIKRPLKFDTPGFHKFVYIASGILLMSSGFFFYLSSPWLALVPLPLLAGSLLSFQIKQASRMKKIVSTAAEIQAKMEGQGSSQLDIIKAVCLGTTGTVWDRDWDGDVKSFLKYFVLNYLMSYSESEELGRAIENMSNPNYKSTSAEIDKMFDSYYEREKRTLAYITEAKSQSSGMF